MKKIWIFLICGFFVFSFPSFCSASTTYWKFPGVVFKSSGLSAEEGGPVANPDFAQVCPDCGPMGQIAFFKWKDINQTEGGYNFGVIENFLNQAKNQLTVPFPDGTRIPKPVVVEISIFYADGGDLTPSWVYSNGTTQDEVVCSDTLTFYAPPYYDTRWKNAYFTLISALGTYFEQRKSNYPNLAGFIFSPGYDDESYPVVYWCDYDQAYRYKQFLAGLAGAMKNAFPTIPVYLPAGGEGYTADVINGAVANGIGVKSNTFSDGAGEVCCFRWAGNTTDPRTILGNPANAMVDKPWSAAMNRNETTSWAFEDARHWNYFTMQELTYSQVLMAMAFRTDWWDFRDVRTYQELAKKDTRPRASSFLGWFVPTYMGKTKANTSGAWIAFRDIRDNTIYGPAHGDAEWVRGMEIWCWGSSVCDTHTFGDFNFYIRRVGDSGSTKIFKSNLPSPAQNQIFGFGRVLPADKYMSLRLEDGLWFRSGTRNMDLKLIVVNSGVGSIEIEFRKSDGSVYKETITKGAALGSQDAFVEVSRAIPSVIFDGSMVDGGDFVVRSVGGQSIIHMLEVRPLEGDISPTPTPVHSFNFVAGWNNIAWQSGWPSRSFANVPQQCPYVSYRQNDWFSDWARNYNVAETFSSGEYQIYCNQAVSWNI